MTGWLWWVVGIGTIALGVVIAYGFANARKRSQAAQAKSEAATDKLYQKEDEAP